MLETEVLLNMNYNLSFSNVTERVHLMSLHPVPLAGVAVDGHYKGEA